MYYVMSYAPAGCADHIQISASFPNLEEARSFVAREFGIDITDPEMRWDGLDEDDGLVPVEAWHESREEGCGGVQIMKAAA